MHVPHHLPRSLAGVVIVLTIAACAGGRSALPDGEVSYSAHVEALLVARCASCHASSEPKGGLVLERGRGYAQLVGRTSTQVDRPLVAPGDPEASYLWHKLVDRAEQGKGMPRNALGYRRLPEDELTLVRRWIEDGAKP